MDLMGTILTTVVLFLASPIIINATDSSVNKLDEDPIKCTPCQQNPPPPPPPVYCPPPPPPRSPPPPPPSSPPPPPPKSPLPPVVYPPPPPPAPTYIYPTPPGDLYPVDFGAAAARESLTAVVKLVVFGVMAFMIL